MILYLLPSMLIKFLQIPFFPHFFNDFFPYLPSYQLSIFFYPSIAPIIPQIIANYCPLIFAFFSIMLLYSFAAINPTRIIIFGCSIIFNFSSIIANLPQIIPKYCLIITSYGRIIINYCPIIANYCPALLP